MLTLGRLPDVYLIVSFFGYLCCPLWLRSAASNDANAHLLPACTANHRFVCAAMARFGQESAAAVERSVTLLKLARNNPHNLHVFLSKVLGVFF